jgi:hypothetical protein
MLEFAKSTPPIAHPRKHVKLSSAVKTLISGAISRNTTFTLIVACRYHQKFAAAVTINDQA